MQITKARRIAASTPMFCSASSFIPIPSFFLELKQTVYSI